MDQSISILVVDDSPSICKQLAEILTGAGYDVSVVMDGLEAIKAIKNRKFHLVTLDVEMPGMQGTEVLRIIKAIDPDLFVIMVSGVSGLQTVLHAIRQGAYDYVTKPFEAEDLLMTVQRALRQRCSTFENRKLIDDLQSLNEHLEDLVYQRTSELEEAHHQLLSSHRQLEDAYRRLRELDSLKVKFIAITSHELKTPLTTIRGYAAWLASNKRSPEQQAQALSAMERSIEKLVGIVAEITDIAKLREKRMLLRREPTDLTKIIAMILHESRPYLEERHQTLETKFEGPMSEVYADRARVHQILLHLVMNAMRFTPDGGQITIATRAESQNGFMQVSVTDTGIGIDEPLLEKIFEEFYEAAPYQHHHSGTIQFQSGGLGLGLSVVRGIVEEHGGRIWAESHKSQGIPGSTFHFLLPKV